MARALSVEVRGIDTVRRRLGRLPNDVQAAIKRARRIGTEIVYREIRARVGGGTLKVRTGTHLRSIHKDLENGIVWSDLRSMLALEHGGVIRPRHRKYLAIPVPGSPADTKRRRPDSFPNRFIIISRKTGLPILMARLTAKGDAVPIYILKPSVRLRPGRMWQKTFQIASPQVARVFDREMGKAIRGN